MNKSVNEGNNEVPSNKVKVTFYVVLHSVKVHMNGVLQVKHMALYKIVVGDY